MIVKGQFVPGLLASRVLCVLLLTAAPVFGVVLHDDDDAPTSRPDDDVVGRWRTNGSAVAVGRAICNTTNYILTTRHQGQAGGEDPNYVYFGSTQYKVAEIWNEPGEGGTGDMRICRIETLAGEDANLTSFVPWRDTGAEIGRQVVFGGFGKGRGSDLYTPGGKLYGYTWSGGSNDTLRWGSNTIDGSSVVSGGGFTSYILKADFDAPRTHNASLAEWDSGGGWFIESDGEWQVAGLSRGAEHALDDESWFCNSASGFVDPDNIDAVRISSYADWIDSIVFKPVEGDADTDGDVDLDDLSILASNWLQPAEWRGGDFTGDSFVDLDDLSLLAGNWQDGVEGEPMGFDDAMQDAFGDPPVPEPATICLLGLGAAALLRKRRQAVKRAP